MDNFDGFDSACKIKIIGVGGAGNNAVNCMFEQQIIGCEFYVLNTDAQILGCSKVENKLVLGKGLTKGLGAGANPEIGEKAAIASENEIREIVKGADMVFIAAGMGGGTGTGAAPVVARIAKEEDCLVVGIVTRPFTFEGKNRMLNASKGLENLKQYVDTLITISNDKILQLIGNLPLKESFKEADNVLRKSVQAITDLIAMPALINLDFADVKTVMSKKGPAMIGFGVGKGANRAKESALNALNSPLLEHSIKGARNAIVSIAGGQNSTLYDFNDAVEFIRNQAESDINIIFGASINEMLEDEMQVTVIATDFVDAANEYVIPSFNPNFERKPINEVDNVKDNDNLFDSDTETLLPDFLKNK
ncbi:MAG: cell division protein FtsZ [Erysipelotrichaceae bacterium]|nr:cell division protein FtsZ [Erysipelotrichaceae bacterium]